jgi:hypothetical protein
MTRLFPTLRKDAKGWGPRVVEVAKGPGPQLHLYGFDGEGVSLDGAFDGNLVSGVGNEGFRVGDLVDLVAYDEDGGGATLDALGGAVGGVGHALGSAHGVGDEAFERLGVGASGGEGEGEGGEEYELFHGGSPEVFCGGWIICHGMGVLGLDF